MGTHHDQWLTDIYRETFPHAARVVQKMGGDLETARDLFHDAMIIYLEKQKDQRLQIKVSPQAYLVGITKILYIRKLKQDAKETTLGDNDVIIPEDFYAPPPAGNKLISYLKTAGNKCLQLLKAFYYEQRSVQEIATDFQYKTTHSVSVQKYKCLEKVREQVKQHHYEETAC
ncbi:RNA polymerase sigma factor [Chitinophaga vietnamensis]|uniref:RNA polymerase sigma factor n=1 Tax=Chitinophaga vietnamensis TaxID=2593957 RepID=UPI00117817A7|nr:sigma-70 family RNA polymerase sigma factor [Chitinophaga vietnamensis]